MTSQAALTLQYPAPAITSQATIQELGWWMPLFLFIGGWISYLFRDNLGFEIGTAIGTIVVLRAVYLLMIKCQDVRFTWVIGCGLLLGYAFGSLNTALQLAKTHQTIAQHFSESQDNLSIALSVVLWVGATLFLAGIILEIPVSLDLTKLRNTDISYVYLGVLIYFGALATGQIGYMGATVSDDHHVTAIGSVAGLIGPTLPAITVLLRRKSRLLRNQLVFWILLVLEMVGQLPLGRRAIIYAVLCVIFAFTLVGDRWKSPLWKKALVISVCLVSLYTLNLVFFAMRHAAQQSGAAKKMGATDMSLSELVSAALTFIEEGRDTSFDEEMAANLRDRTFVLPYFSDLLAQSWTHPALHGQLLVFAFQMATPSAIYSLFGGKEKVLALGMEEFVANPNFGLFATDQANSLLTGGVSDFGVIGVFVYPLILALLINFGLRVALARAPEFLRYVALMMFLNSCFQTEVAVTGYVVGTRNLIFLLIAWVPVSAVMKYFMISPNRVPNALDGRRRPTAGVTLVRYEAVPRGR